MSMTMVEIEKQLKDLRLSGMLATLESRALQAGQSNAGLVEALSWLLQDELDHRSSNLKHRRFKASGLDELKTLTDFDWGFNPKLPKKEIYELVTAKFIQNGEHALCIGAPGTGKAILLKPLPTLLSNCSRKRYIGRPMYFLKTCSRPNRPKSKKDLQTLYTSRSFGY